MEENTRIEIYDVDATHFQVVVYDAGIKEELWEYFTIEVPNAYWIRKNTKNSGKIRLFNKLTHRLYQGLFEELEIFCSDRDYELIDLRESIEFDQAPLDKLGEAFLKEIKISDGDGNEIELHHYQEEAFLDFLYFRRSLAILPTSSGKSLIIYLIIRFFLEYKKYSQDGLDNKILLVVPDLTLLSQMVNDFKDYSQLNGWDADAHCHKIKAGVEKNSDLPVYVSTYQSIAKQPKEYFEQFDVVIVDEVHGAEAKSVKTILENSCNAWNRFGCSGTIKSTKTHKMTLQGLFTKPFKYTNYRELEKMKKVSTVTIKMICLNYINHPKTKKKYLDELKYIDSQIDRDILINDIVNQDDGNAIILVKTIEKCKELEALIKKESPHKKVIWFKRELSEDEKQEAKDFAEENQDVVFIATFKMLSTGVSINNIQRLLLVSSTKAEITVPQTIGRGMRKDGKENKLEAIDLVDKTCQNGHVYGHAKERLKIYREQGYKVEFEERDFHDRKPSTKRK